MTGKIAVEEHFAIEDTLRESTEYAVPGQLNMFERRMLDLDDERLREMDAHGIAFAILSLNAPGVQSVFDRRKAIDRPARQTLAAASPGIDRAPDLRRWRCGRSSRRRAHAASTTSDSRA
jgi:2,3-dihydroxybenzoate decarboxylase